MYNTVLRRFPKEKYDMLQRGRGGKGGNLYTTTIYVLVSAVLRMARRTKLRAGTKLYRGLGGDRTFPPSFRDCDALGRKGILEWGFMSTTMDKEQAIKYCGIKQKKPVPTILELDSGSLDRGADISSLSQYPGGSLFDFSVLRCNLTI